MITHTRIFLLPVCVALAALAFARPPVVRSQVDPLAAPRVRRITVTPPFALNLNPTLSGDGSRVSFESNAATYDQSGVGFRLLQADADAGSVRSLARTRAPAPALSRDGSTIVFASADDPLGSNFDHNSEIFIYENGTLRQLTNTAPRDLTSRTRDGNFNPSASSDGRFIAFASACDIAGRNADRNSEIVLYDRAANSFAQITDSANVFGSSAAKITGDAARIAYIFQNANTADADASLPRSLMLYERATGSTRALAADLAGLDLTYGRAISDDGSRVVFSADTGANAQVFVYDSRANAARQITNITTRSADVSLRPTISGDGSRLAFATRRSFGGFSNPDRGVELYLYDFPLARFTRVTDSSDGSAVEVISSLNDDGTRVAFNFPRAFVLEAANTEFASNSEIFVAELPAPAAAATDLSIFNAAALERGEPPVNTVAPDSIAVARGSRLARATLQASPADGVSPPLELGGTTITVAGRAAGLLAVSPTQINFVVPPETPFGSAQVVVTNANGLRTQGSVNVMRAAPGVFTRAGDGAGEAVALDARTLLPPPFDPLDVADASRRVLIFATGVRGATAITATLDGEAARVLRVLRVPGAPGLDQIEIALPPALINRGQVELRLAADGRASNLTLLTIAGISINELLADPPADSAGDANRDGIRSASQDEFVELVNGSIADVDLSDYEIVVRDSGGAETIRHRFPERTFIVAGTSFVIFGGASSATFDPNRAEFGGSQIALASSGSLGLPNGGALVLLRAPGGRTTSSFAYGSSGTISGNQNQSVTRSPDIRGDLTTHTLAPDAAGRVYSPGTRTNGAPFTASPVVAHVALDPPGATLLPGEIARFTARAFDANGAELPGVRFTFESSDTNVARVDEPGDATAVAPGTASVTAIARGVRSTSATIVVQTPQPTITRIEVAPSTLTLNRGAGATLTARAFDRNNAQVANAAFTFTSLNPLIAEVVTDSDRASAVVRGTGSGRATIRAATSDGAGGTVTAAAEIDVRVPLVINEVLADVPPDDPATLAIEGDANRDGRRDAGDDEFVELVNVSDAPLDISAIRLSDATSTRYTFPAGTTLAPAQAAIVFGGGTPTTDAAEFGGALHFTTSTLSLNDTGDTVNVRLPVGETEALIATQTYGAAAGATPAPRDQSLTRSPDAHARTTAGDFVPHGTAANAAGRVFSAGTRADGTPFNSAPLTRIEITPVSAVVNVGDSQTFTARAFARDAQNMEVEVPGVSFIWDADNAVRFTPRTGRTIVVTTTRAGTTTINARAGTLTAVATLVVNSLAPRIARIEVAPAAATINRGARQQFAARAFDDNNQIVPDTSFTWSSSAPSIASADSATGLAIGTGRGTATIIATASDNRGGTATGSATLTVLVPLVINEFLADPAEGAAGDANRDGTRDGTQDEFVEIVNDSDALLDISGVRLADAAGVRFTVPAGTTLAPRQALVVFGGGTPDPTDVAFGGALIRTASGGLSFNNDGDTIRLLLQIANADASLAAISYGGATGLNGSADQSLTRSPDITGAFVLHTVARPGKLFSPGTRVDGSPF